MADTSATSGDGAPTAADAELAAGSAPSGQPPADGLVVTGGTQPPGGAQLAPDAWHVVGTAGQPKFIGDWRNDDSMFGNAPYFNSAAFFKDAAGVVHLRGVVENGTSPPIFTLPAGFFPPRFHRYPAVLVTRIVVTIEISPSGTVSRLNVAGGRAEGTSLEGISFRAT